MRQHWPPPPLLPIRWRLLPLPPFLLVLLLTLAWLTPTSSQFKTRAIALNRLAGVTHAEFQVKLDYSLLDGPGRHLSHNLYPGNVIFRQTFETQFIQDLSKAGNMSTSRIFVMDVEKGKVSSEWEANSVLVTFRLYDKARSNDTSTLLNIVRDLTYQIQTPTSLFYQGKVLSAVDPLFGLVSLSWDLSLRLQYALEVIGADAVKSQAYLNQGSDEYCKRYSSLLSLYSYQWANLTGPRIYCQFESFYRQDLSLALNISMSRVQVLYVKEAARDWVLVHTRFYPPTNFSTAETNTSTAIFDLAQQVKNISSPLYQGNVTVRVDRAWGVSGHGATPRGYNPYARYASMPTSDDAYERCKATHRCNRAAFTYNQTAATVNFTDQLYSGGLRKPAALFDDFEDWRSGTFGWAHRGRVGSTSNRGLPRGAHFNPFDFDPLGPTVTTADFRYNQGLVLDNTSQQLQLAQLDEGIAMYQSQIDFMEANVETAVLDARSRARVDVRRVMLAKINNTQALQAVLIDRRQELAVSQCFNMTNCTLHFNTTAATLTGAMNFNGSVMLTSSGTEVVVFAFDSIQLGPEVNVTLSGQRALVLLSRSSVVLNTTFQVTPSTYGGFLGGYSVARSANDTFSDHPRDIYLRSIMALNGTPSNNINGPGSGSVRVYLYTITSSTADIDEIHRVSTFARQGQTIRGGFTLSYGNRTTRMIPCDATAAQVKKIMEVDLNVCDPYDRRDCKRVDMERGVGLLNVSRSARTDVGGYNWTITYRTTTGNIPQIRAKSHLTGVGSGILTQTLQNGNSMGGAFTLSFLGKTSRQLAFDVDAATMEAALAEDMPDLTSVSVIRTDPTGKCSDGLCDNGPYPGYGYMWTLTLTTEVGNISPTSPTSPDTYIEGGFGRLQAQNYLTGPNSQIWVTLGHSMSTDDQKRRFNVTRPFSLAFGGGGAGYGGQGGAGYGSNPIPKEYGDRHISDLLGGSGGAMGDISTSAIYTYMYPPARGGSGGGAVEIVAANDITIGTSGAILVDAQDGFPGSQYGGGGGAGGSVLLSAGGVIYHEGTISARGGNGGATNWPEGFGGGGGAGGRVAMYGQSVSVAASGRVDVGGGKCPPSTVSSSYGNAPICTRHGDDGTFYVWSRLGARYYVDTKEGAAGTSRALYLTTDQRTRTASGVLQETPFPRDGPEYVLAGGRPERVTFYIKLGGLHGAEMTSKANWNWGAMFALLSDHGDPAGLSANASIALGVSFTDNVQHGVDFYYDPSEHKYPPYLSEAMERVHLYVWYKVDLLLFWSTKRYDLRIDDVTYVRQAPYTADSFQRIGLYSFPRGEVWFDEIFAGTDVSMNMQCPLISSTGVSMDRPLQTSWPLTEIGGFSYNHRMTRWLSHIGLRHDYEVNNGGLVPFDGEAHQAYMSDIKVRFDTGDKHITPGKVLAGVLTHLDGSTPNRITQHAAMMRASDNDFWSVGDLSGTPTVGKTGQYFWYGEHDYTEGMPEFGGGVAACSTDDFITWKFEGIMLHYANLTDMVYGSKGPFIVERPKVLYNDVTKKYVMWMSVDNHNRSLGLAGIAISDYRNGPYDFIRTFYPGGNETHDQLVYQASDGTAYLGRTYYQDVEYVMPSRVMQPIWEGVRNVDGSINFPLNSHRAYYNADYDDYNDVYLQRWRTEDEDWSVVCVNRITGTNRTVHRGNLTIQGTWCDAPSEYKLIEGFGSPKITTRYKDPFDAANSLWVPNSVPGVKAQPWQYNYMDGTCGIHKTDDGYQDTSPGLDGKTVPDRSNCSNIADNAPHKTFPDKLIGPPEVVLTRRAKYVAISRLTDDYLDTTGIITSFEGELEGEEHLISLITQSGQFQWSTGSELGSTYVPQVHSEFTMADDWERRYHQYEENYNDRAWYSLACVLDGDCPVNFASQLVDGNQ